MKNTFLYPEIKTSNPIIDVSGTEYYNHRFSVCSLNFFRNVFDVFEIYSSAFFGKDISQIFETHRFI